MEIKRIVEDTRVFDVGLNHPRKWNSRYPPYDRSQAITYTFTPYDAKLLTIMYRVASKFIEPQETLLTLVNLARLQTLLEWDEGKSSIKPSTPEGEMRHLDIVNEYLDRMEKTGGLSLPFLPDISVLQD